jgi:hypothetical protein
MRRRLHASAAVAHDAKERALMVLTVAVPGLHDGILKTIFIDT